MKKKLNVDSIQSELRGGSAFFPGYKGQDAPPPLQEEAKQANIVDTPPKENKPAEPKTSRDTMIPRHQPCYHGAK